MRQQLVEASTSVRARHRSRSVGRAALATLALAALMPMARGTPHPFPDELWVDPANGSDLNQGGENDPLQTVNVALQMMVDNQAPSGSTVKVKYTSQPIAPKRFGGFEKTGWAIPPASHPGFPLRMLDGVDIIGLPGPGGERPRITIDESLNSYQAWQQNFSDLPGVVVAASNATLQGFDVDGSQLSSSSLDNTDGVRLAGLHVPAVSGFNVVDCVIRDWGTEVRIEPGDGNLCRANFVDSHLTDAGPLDPPGPQGPGSFSEGHAALEYEGPGDAIVHFFGGSIERSHDAIEPEVGDGDEGMLVLRIYDTLFDCNENGLEVGGPYDLDIEIHGATFRNDFPHTPPSNLPGANAIGLRAFEGDSVLVKVRDCHFLDYSRALFWLAQDDDVVLDLGTDEDPGGNTFCQDYGPTGDDCFPGATTPPSVFFGKAIVQASVTPAGEPHNVIRAAGNWWIPNNQGAVGRALTGSVTATPPGGPPGVGLDCNEDRNYWIVGPSASMPGEAGEIHFGSMPPSGSDPLPCEDCAGG